MDNAINNFTKLEVNMNDFLSTEFLGNSIEAYIISAGLLIISSILSLVLKKIIFKSARGNEFITVITKKFLTPLIFLVSVYVILDYLVIPAELLKILNVVYIIVAAWYITRLLIRSLGFTIDRFLQKTKTDEDQKRIKPLFSFLNFTLWILASLFILSYLGFNVTTVLAGLGIGGIAIALAAQTILGDLFNYFVIFFDKPFEIGDFLIFDDKTGTVEKIGIKSTRIRTLNGEQLIVSNSNLVNTRVHNFKRMERRRVVFMFGVLYETSLEKLKKIPALVKSIIEENELTTFDRSHFKSFGNFSLDFENVYFISNSDYITYMDIQQNINFKLSEEFAREGIEFAYPTQTLYVNNTKSNF